MLRAWLPGLTRHARKYRSDEPDGPPVVGHGVTHVVSFGIVLVIAGQFYGWNNQALQHGFQITMVCYFLVAAGYLALCLCIAEMSSSFAFGGGTFGYARCILSPAIGYLVGSMELLEYLFVVVVGVRQLAAFLTVVFSTSALLEPLWCVLFYVASLPALLRGGPSFSWPIAVLAALPVAVTIFYFFASAPTMDIKAHARFDGEDRGTGGLTSFLAVLPTMVWIFLGMEGLVLVADDTRNPHVTVPRATVLCWAVIVAMSVLVLFASCSTAPGSAALADASAIMTPGLQRIFRWTEAAAMVLTLPATLGAPFAFVHASAKLVASMSQSCVYHSALGRTQGPYDSPVAGLGVVSTLTLALVLVSFAADAKFMAYVFDACILCSCFVYVSTAACYWAYSERYSNVIRRFRSPLGRAGAVYCAALFCLVFAELAFHRASMIPFTIFAVFFALAGLHYVTVATHSQFFSEAEVRTFMKAYVINSNLRRKMMIKRKYKALALAARTRRTTAPSTTRRAAQVLPEPPGCGEDDDDAPSIAVRSKSGLYSLDADVAAARACAERMLEGSGSGLFGTYAASLSVDS